MPARLTRYKRVLKNPWLGWILRAGCSESQTTAGNEADCFALTEKLPRQYLSPTKPNQPTGEYLKPEFYDEISTLRVVFFALTINLASLLHSNECICERPVIVAVTDTAARRMPPSCPCPTAHSAAVTATLQAFRTAKPQVGFDDVVVHLSVCLRSTKVKGGCSDCSDLTLRQKCARGIEGRSAKNRREGGRRMRLGVMGSIASRLSRLMKSWRAGDDVQWGPPLPAMMEDKEHAVVDEREVGDADHSVCTAHLDSWTDAAVSRAWGL
ncbi:hypothetical protein DFH09DRAFT_1073185 [Mycena vulgaris]|nr:hypothetical protein DFH09DRAFT_1073185 [Mycena vulgaris]